MKFTNAKIALRISAAGALLSIFVFSTACHNAQTKTYTSPTPETKKQADKRQWIPGVYSGIEIGKTTKEDLIGKFGKPFYEGAEALEGEDADVEKALARHSGKRILLEFKDVGGMNGKTSVFVGEKDKIVQAIALYPAKPFTREEIIERYGDAFIEKLSNESICSAVEKSPPRDYNDNRKVSTESNANPPEMLVFPEKGMYASFDAEGKFDLLGFSLKCGD